MTHSIKNVAPIKTAPALNLRLATLEDLDALAALEERCFEHDRLSKRRFRHWLQAPHGILWVAQVGGASGGELAGYGLVWCHKGTRLARLYSLAISPGFRGQGMAVSLLTALEEVASEQGRLFMRLEVAKNNAAAISLYEGLGYRVFGEYCDYYDDHSDALRMQKTIQRVDAQEALTPVRWYHQTTEFTCGPAALMMAMSGINKAFKPDQAQELDIWREATTIFMTSGHGGCHPIGLALAANKRGYKASAFVSTDQPLFLEGVRSQHKKDVMTLVHQQFVAQAQQQSVEISYASISQQEVEHWLKQGSAVIMLISTYQLDGRKAPHWVTITHCDERCLYVHDPDLDESKQLAIDCQYLPIAREDFEKMSSFGSNRLRAAVVLEPRQ